MLGHNPGLNSVKDHHSQEGHILLYQSLFCIIKSKDGAIFSTTPPQAVGLRWEVAPCQVKNSTPNLCFQGKKTLG